MGTWGVGLYQDDITCDIQSDYLDWLRIGKTNEEATNIILEEEGDYYDDDEDEYAALIIALADTQWKKGRLLPEIKEKALYYIKNGTELKRWEEEPKLLEKRRKVLEKVAERLNSPQPPAKKIAPLRLNKRLYQDGDIILCKITDQLFKDTKWYGSYVTLKVVGFCKLYIGSLPRDKYYHIEDVVKIYNFYGKNKPSLEEINNKKSISNYEFEKHVLSLTKREVKKLNLELVKKGTPNDKGEDFTYERIGFTNVYNTEGIVARDLVNYEKKHPENC